MISILLLSSLSLYAIDVNTDSLAMSIASYVYTPSERYPERIYRVIDVDGLYENDVIELSFHQTWPEYTEYTPTSVKLYFNTEVFEVTPSAAMTNKDGTYAIVTLPYKYEKDDTEGGYYNNGKNYQFKVKANAPGGRAVIKAALFYMDEQISELDTLYVDIIAPTVINITDNDSARIYQARVRNYFTYRYNGESISSRYLIVPGRNEITIDYNSLNQVSHEYEARLTTSGPLNFNIYSYRNSSKGENPVSFSSNNRSQSISFYLENNYSTSGNGQKQAFRFELYDKVG